MKLTALRDRFQIKKEPKPDGEMCTNCKSLKTHRRTYEERADQPWAAKWECEECQSCWWLRTGPIPEEPDCLFCFDTGTILSGGMRYSCECEDNPVADLDASCLNCAGAGVVHRAVEPSPGGAGWTCPSCGGTGKSASV